MEVALEKIDILIDLNGGTLNSGLYYFGLILYSCYTYV